MIVRPTRIGANPAIAFGADITLPVSEQRTERIITPVRRLDMSDFDILIIVLVYNYTTLLYF